MATLQRLALRGTPKATKQAARYTPAGGAERCGMCRHYVPSSSCARIEGPVSAAGWCQLYSQQVTWRPRAGQDAGLNPGLVPPGVTLDLSFLTPGTLDPRITFTRASTATYFDSAGTLRTAAANAPRWDYDPATHALRGLLIEEQRTNIVLNSADASNASWQKLGVIVAAPTVTANQAVAPDGTTTAARAVYPAVSAAGNASALAIPFTATGAAYAMSVWLKGNAGGEQLYLYTTNDAVTYYKTPVTLTTAWQRFSFVATVNASNWFFEVGCDKRDATQTSTAAQTIFVWGGQVELGAFPTSYIPTTAASVTRTQEQCRILPANMGFYVSPGGSWMAEYVSQNPVGNFTRVVGYPAASGQAPLYNDGGNHLSQSDGGSVVAVANVTVVGAVSKGASTYAAHVGTTCSNGGIVGSGAMGGDFGPLAGTGVAFLATVAAGSSENTTGYIRRVRYWPRVLTNAELQSVTT